MGVTDERVKDASSVSDLGHVRMELPSMELGGAVGFGLYCSGPNRESLVGFLQSGGMF